MHTILNHVLTVNELARVHETIAAERFIDGRATSALAGKNNLQLPLGSEPAARAGAIVLDALSRHDLFNLAVHPVAIHRPLFSKYECGMEYPDHIDVAVMGAIRTDVAVTVFLSDHTSYDGGELVVDTGAGIREYRLQAGDAIAYPASTVHHINKVTRGERLVCVLWAQSMIRSAAQRRILFDVGLSMRSLSETSCGPLLHRSYWNLMRLWAETHPALQGTRDSRERG